jgi:hypothetical protein
MADDGGSATKMRIDWVQISLPTSSPVIEFGSFDAAAERRL